MILILILRIFWCHVPPLDFDASSVLTFFVVFVFLFPQHTVSVLPRGRGPALPLHLAAYIHPRAAALHVRHRLHPDPLHRGPPLQLPASTQRAAHRRGQIRLWSRLWCLSLIDSSRKWHLSLPCCLFSTGLGRGPRQQSLSAAGNERAQQILLHVVILKGRAVFWLLWHLCLSPFTAGWWGLHSATQAAGGSGACAGQEERAGLW